jgi:hypothetical protein
MAFEKFTMIGSTHLRETEYSSESWDLPRKNDFNQTRCRECFRFTSWQPGFWFKYQRDKWFPQIKALHAHELNRRIHDF